MFYITDQLNIGSRLITEKREKEKLIQLNYQCGVKARKSSAYESAKKYIETGIDLLENRFREDLYDLCLGIYTEAVETAYLNRDFDSMNRYAAIVINNAHNIYDAVHVYETQLAVLKAGITYQEAAHGHGNRRV